MWTRAHRFSPLAAALIAVLAACADEPQAPTPVPPLFSHGGSHTVSGTVLGPDNTSICNFMPVGTSVRVRALDPVNAPLIAAQQFVTCPTNSYSIAVAPGTYRVQAGMPDDPGIGMLPFRYLEPGDVVVNGGDVVRDIQVQNGIPMGGSVTLDGSPIAGVDLTLSYGFPQSIVAAIGVSGSDGAWDDALPARSPMLVQSGVRYTAAGTCGLLGTRVLQGPPSGSFLFPTEVSAINCALETGVAFSHTLTRLVVTPMPGDIGGQSRELFDQFGLGWGVQFPVSPPASPVHAPAAASHLFAGGLVVGIAPNVVLAGSNPGGFECGAACRDFGLDGTMSFAVKPSGSKKVTWTYSDATSGEGVGLKVVQKSFDGRPPADYVLFKFRFTNTSNVKRTFYAGFFGDWDLDDVGDFSNDVGFTALGGKLMYVTNNGEVGVHVGTMLLGDFPVTGTYFLGAGANLTLVDQVNALSGAITQTSLGPTDIRYYHGVGPIKLKRHQSAVIWIAVVAGETREQLLANAAAAKAEVQSRGDDDQGEDER